MYIRSLARRYAATNSALGIVIDFRGDTLNFAMTRYTDMVVS